MQYIKTLIISLHSSQYKTEGKNTFYMQDLDTLFAALQYYHLHLAVHLYLWL